MSERLKVLYYEGDQFKAQMEELGLDNKQEPDFSFAPVPPSPEVVAYENKMAAESTPETPDHAGRHRARLGAIGIMASLHPDITTANEAVEQRLAFENRDTSAVNYLAHFAQETLAARTRQVGRWMSKVAMRAIGRDEIHEPVRQAPSRFSPTDLGILQALSDAAHRRDNPGAAYA